VQIILLIARNTLRENLRRRVLYIMIVFVLALVALLESAARFEQTIQVRMVKDFTYAIVSAFTLVVALICTFDQIPAEMDSKTIYLALARPISRQKFLLGKLLGIVTVLTLFVALMGLILVGAVAMGSGRGLTLDAQLAQGLFVLYLKYVSWAALLLWLSILMSRPLAVVLALFVYFYGHVSGFITASIQEHGAGALDAVVTAFNFVMPKFSFLDPPGDMIYAQSYSLGSLGLLAAYAATFAILYVVLSVWTFASQEL